MMSRRVRSWTSSIAIVMALAVIPAVFVTIATPALGNADVCAEVGSDAALPLDIGPCADVLAQEARWLTAITDGDRDTVDSILSVNFRHITSQGVLLDRPQEIASMVKEPFTMNATEQIVDIAGDTAVIHGRNTITQAGKVPARERFTDVFVLANGQWMALSAQETAT
jgi:hypothetical protein